MFLLQRSGRFLLVKLNFHFRQVWREVIGNVFRPIASSTCPLVTVREGISTTRSSGMPETIFGQIYLSTPPLLHRRHGRYNLRHYVDMDVVRNWIKEVGAFAHEELSK